MHPNLAPIAALVGSWQGPGRGEYPTIEPFTYIEELTFTDVDKPLLAYQQRTWSPEGVPMHIETGYLRLPDSSTIELILAQPTGQTELAEGTLSLEPGGFVAELASRVMNSASAKHVEATERRLHLSGAELTVSFAMATARTPMTHHLRSVLRRQ